MKWTSKKTITLVLFIILSLLIYPNVIADNLSIDDELDQFQNDTTNDNAEINQEKSWAQSFKPKMVILSRVELYMDNRGSSDEIRVSIKKDLEGSDLTSITISTLSIPMYEKNWIEFDFSDITVEPDETYYIVCIHSSKKSVNWAASFNNYYSKGKAYYKILNPDSKWKSWEETMPFPYSVDLCFKTYGMYHAPSQPSEPKGPNQIRINGIGQYYTSSEDLDGDLIRYGWDFDDDDIVDEWTDYFQSGEICKINVSWDKKGDKLIKVIAEDSNGILSKWSDSKTLVVPKYKTEAIMNLLNFLKQIFSFKLFFNNL